MTIMKEAGDDYKRDAIGQRLEIGDRVVYVKDRYASNIIMTVVGFTPTKVKVEFPSNDKRKKKPDSTMFNDEYCLNVSLNKTLLEMDILDSVCGVFVESRQ